MYLICKDYSMQTGQTAVWQRHLTTPFDNAVWQHRLTTPFDNAIWQRRLTMPFDNAVQQRHSTRPSRTPSLFRFFLRYLFSGSSWSIWSTSKCRHRVSNQRDSIVVRRFDFAETQNIHRRIEFGTFGGRSGSSFDLLWITIVVNGSWVNCCL